MVDIEPDFWKQIFDEWYGHFTLPVALINKITIFGPYKKGNETVYGIQRGWMVAHFDCPQIRENILAVTAFNRTATHVTHGMFFSSGASLL